MFDKGTLVLEGVTLTQMVQMVIEMLVNLARGTILDQKTSEHSQAAHPQNLTGTLSASCLARRIDLDTRSTTIPPASLRRGTAERVTHDGILAFAVPFLLPKPRWRPMRRAAVSSRARERECMVTGLRMMRPSATSLRTDCRELAAAISLASFGSSQILRWPQPTTEAASRFCVRRFTLREMDEQGGGGRGRERE